METQDNGLNTPDNEQNKPEMRFDVSALFRAQADREKKAYQEWLNKLTPEEMQTYEQMGYHFQLLRAICQNLEMIALSKDDNDGERFSFDEVVDLVKDVEKMAVRFLGREAKRKQSPTLNQLVKAYNVLRVFASRQEEQTFTENDEGYSLSVRPHFDNDFMELIESAFPKDMVTIIEEMERGQKEKNVTGREEATRSFEKMVVGLQLNDTEKAEFIEALKTIVKVRQKVTGGKKMNGQKMNQIDLGDLQDVIDALSRMECLRRVFHISSELGIRGNDHDYGIHEINRLVQFIGNWKKTFKWLGKMKVGKIVYEEKEEDREENEEEIKKRDEEREKSEQEELEKKYDIIKNFTDSFNTIFPNPVAPMIVRRHREVLRHRIRNYPYLGRIVDRLPDNYRMDFKRVLYQISTTLSYLDYMWNMHQVEENSAGKHIVYPKKMLLLGPFILQEIENLGAMINMIVMKHDKRRKEEPEMGDGFFEMETEPKGLAIPYEDSVEFRIGPEGIIATTHDSALSAADAQTEEELRKQEQNKKLMDNLEMICYLLNEQARQARRSLSATKVKKVITNDEDDTEEEKSSPTLSYDIHDFINDIRDMFSMVIYQIAVLFEEKVDKHELLPELEAHEEQAARLRGHVHALGKRIRPATLVMAYAMGSNRNLAPDEQFPDGLRMSEIVPSLNVIINNLAGDIGEFQRYQEKNLNAKKYHEVLRGAGYEKLVRLANSLSDFTANYQEKFDSSTIDLYILRKKLDEFAEKLQMDTSLGKLPRNGIIGAWLKDLENLKKVENRILANGLKPKEMEKLQREYTENFMHVLNLMFDICRKDEVIHQIPDKKDPEIIHTVTYDVAPAVKERFAAFSKSHPLSENCTTDNFTQTFYKFYKLSHLMSDFMQVCDLQMNPNTPEQEFLKEHDMRKAEILNKECRNLLKADYNGTERTQKNSLLLSLAACREALSHLLFRAHDQAETLDAILSDMENTITTLYQHGKPIDPEDLETFYLQFIREAVENPIRVGY